MRIAPTALAIAFLAAPAHAWDGAQIPEPSNLALFGLGLAGVIIGRHASRRRRRGMGQDADRRD